jgi:hypothetical protein
MLAVCAALVLALTPAQVQTAPEAGLGGSRTYAVSELEVTDADGIRPYDDAPARFAPGPQAACPHEGHRPAPRS